jgi:hypothetical protein
MMPSIPAFCRAKILSWQSIKTCQLSSLQCSQIGHTKGQRTHLSFNQIRVGRQPLQIRQSKCFAFGGACTFHSQFHSSWSFKVLPFLVMFCINLYPLLTIYQPCISLYHTNVSSSTTSNNGVSRIQLAIVTSDHLR